MFGLYRQQNQVMMRCRNSFNKNYGHIAWDSVTQLQECIQTEPFHDL